MLETFQNLEHFPSILRVESTSESSKTKLPPFLRIVREVTNDNSYETWFMAKNDYEMPAEDVTEIKKTVLEEIVKQHSEAGNSSRNGRTTSDTDAELVAARAALKNNIEESKIW